MITAAASDLVVSEHALGPLLNDLSRLLRREFDRRLRAAGVRLTRAQWLILYQVAREEGVSQTALAEKLDLERMTVSRHAARLSHQGWLERRAHEGDARVYRLFLRLKARRVLRDLQPVVERFRQDYFRGLDGERRQALFDDLQHIRANLISLGESERSSPL
jgi:MarR family transcriptional regulator, transcriptional regulator for hemolysin